MSTYIEQTEYSERLMQGAPKMCSLYQAAPCIKQPDTRFIGICTLYQANFYIENIHMFNFFHVEVYSFCENFTAPYIRRFYRYKMDQKILSAPYIRWEGAPCIRRTEIWCTLNQADFYS